MFTSVSPALQFTGQAQRPKRPHPLLVAASTALVSLGVAAAGSSAVAAQANGDRYTPMAKTTKVQAGDSPETMLREASEIPFQVAQSNFHWNPSPVAPVQPHDPEVQEACDTYRQELAQYANQREREIPVAWTRPQRRYNAGVRARNAERQQIRTLLQQERRLRHFYPGYNALCPDNRYSWNLRRISGTQGSFPQFDAQYAQDSNGTSLTWYDRVRNTYVTIPEKTYSNFYQQQQPGWEDDFGRNRQRNLFEW
jgi:hypothetical protein